jgi:hypothetical protein
MDETRENKLSGTTIALLIFAWLWVGIPLAWGVYQTYLKSVPLFR